MDLNQLLTHINSLVGADATLSSFLGGGYLFVGLADKFPAITLTGVVCVDDKQGKYTAALSFFIEKKGDTIAEAATFFEMSDRIKTALEPSNMIAGGAWYDKSSTTHYHALIPVSFWQ
jgi:hypothetical protein